MTPAVLSAKTHCPKGHPLEAPNLVPAALRRGRRQCRQCLREYLARRYAAIRGNPWPMARRGRNQWHKLDAGQVAEIRARIGSGERPSAIATSYGIDPSLVRQIRDGKIWRKL